MQQIREGQRLLRLKDQCGQPFSTRVGSPQGDALTLLEAIVPMCIWHTAITTTYEDFVFRHPLNSPLFWATAYVDDRTLTLRQRRAYLTYCEQLEQSSVWAKLLKALWELTAAFDQATNSKLNWPKSKAASANPTDLCLVPQGLSHSPHLRILGPTLHFSPNTACPPCDQQKITKLMNAIRLCRIAPVPWDGRDLLLGAIGTSVMFAWETWHVPQVTLLKLQTAAVGALWRSTNLMRCKT